MGTAPSQAPTQAPMSPPNASSKGALALRISCQSLLDTPRV
ncbi:hypothetical protein PC116_g34707 [Phytophthora cactorum]|nr:hypothetical protein PC116_g34707 [Phytophthora cactorum]